MKRKVFLEKGNDLLLCFLAFSMIGWIYEVCIMWLEMHEGFVNRGFLYGPWLPIYGCGGLLILLLFGGLRRRKIGIGDLSLTPLVSFLAICLLATVLELGASYLVERFVGHSLWDYRFTNYGPTFEGRIALRSSLQFGLMGMAVLYGVEPLLKKAFRWLREKAIKFYWGTSILLEGLFLADLIYHVMRGSNAPW